MKRPDRGNLHGEEALLGLPAHGPVEPAVVRGVREVQQRRGEVAQHPGNDRVLAQIVVTPTRQTVHTQNVLQIRELPADPPRLAAVPRPSLRGGFTQEGL